MYNYNVVIDILQTFFAGLGLFSIFLIFRQNKNNHEEKRRIFTYEVMYKHTKTLNGKYSAAVNIVEKFDKNQCIAVFTSNTISQTITPRQLTIPIDFKKSILDLLGIENNGVGACTETPTVMTLSNKYTQKLRWIIIEYLNAMEIVCMAYELNIVDREFIESEFKDLVYDIVGVPGSSLKYVLSTFIEYNNIGNGYPYLVRFCENLYNKLYPVVAPCKSKSTL